LSLASGVVSPIRAIAVESGPTGPAGVGDGIIAPRTGTGSSDPDGGGYGDVRPHHDRRRRPPGRAAHRRPGRRDLAALGGRSRDRGGRRKHARRRAARGRGAPVPVPAARDHLAGRVAGLRRGVGARAARSAVRGDPHRRGDRPHRGTGGYRDGTDIAIPLTWLTVVAAGTIAVTLA
jgi:hypothetical protein